MADQETTWDNDSTTWDRDWDGPGTRTIWDLIPADLKIDQLAVVRASRWLATTAPAKWLARAKR